MLARIATSDWAGQRADSARTLFVWIGLGLGYGILLPAITGMLVPISSVFMAVGGGVITPAEALPAAFDSIVRAPYAGLVQAGLGMITGLLAGLVFALGAWMIDAANSSANLQVSPIRNLRHHGRHVRADSGLYGSGSAGDAGEAGIVSAEASRIRAEPAGLQWGRKRPLER